jgi:hypothetical protein
MTVFHPKKPEKEVISMRIPKDVLEILDQKSAQANISRNESVYFVCPCPHGKRSIKTTAKKPRPYGLGNFFDFA